MAPRLSLSKAQQQTALGAELLALCQSVTADGVLTKDEIVELRNWLKANRTSDLPAIGFLVGTLERILADGKVTREERDELYHAIETVLPPEARREAVAARRKVEAAELAAERAFNEQKKQQQRDENLRRKPICSRSFMVAGIYYEGRPEVIEDYVNEGDIVFLVREPKNPFSPNAIAIILTNGLMIGYVPEEEAVELAPLFDEGWPHRALIRKLLVQTRVPIPVVQLYLHRHDSGVEGCVYAKDVPPRKAYAARKNFAGGRRDALPKAKGSGCLSFLLLALPLVLLFVLVWR